MRILMWELARIDPFAFTVGWIVGGLVTALWCVIIDEWPWSLPRRADMRLALRATCLQWAECECEGTNTCAPCLVRHALGEEG